MVEKSLLQAIKKKRRGKEQLRCKEKRSTRPVTEIRTQKSVTEEHITRQGKGPQVKCQIGKRGGGDVRETGRSVRCGEAA